MGFSGEASRIAFATTQNDTIHILTLVGELLIQLLVFVSTRAETVLDDNSAFQINLDDFFSRLLLLFLLSDKLLLSLLLSFQPFLFALLRIVFRNFN